MLESDGKRSSDGKGKVSLRDNEMESDDKRSSDGKVGLRDNEIQSDGKRSSDGKLGRLSLRCGVMLHTTIKDYTEMEYNANSTEKSWQE